MISGLFGGTSEARLLFVGLDASGRTTALYQMVLNETVTTVPTIGFNVETVYHRGINFTVWDVGGCDKIRPLWRHYFQGTQAVVFFVDSNDRDRLDAARDEVHRLMNEDELRNKPLCIAANKQDLPNVMDTAEITEGLGLLGLPKHVLWHVQPVSGTQKLGLQEMMNWIHSAVTKPHESGLHQKEVTETKTKSKKDTPEELQAQKIEETLLNFLQQEDGDDNEFLEKFADCSLESWDHRTHLRIAWLFLKRYGRREGMKKIFAGIKHFIANSPRTYRSRGTTFHETMTYFWIHIVHYAMETTKVPKDDFKTFLLLNPQLANGGLFLHYYSKKLMLQTAESRMEVMLPDIRPLPSLITDVSKVAAGVQSKAVEHIVPRAAPLSDEEFLNRWSEGTLTSWGHEARLRAIWLCLHRHGRKEGVKRAFEGLEKSESTGHHITMTYFWIQMTDFAMQKLAVFSNETIPTFGLFIQKPTSQSLRNPDLIDKYYSQRVINTGKSMFQVPDIKPLPSIVS